MSAILAQSDKTKIPVHSKLLGICIVWDKMSMHELLGQPNNCSKAKYISLNHRKFKVLAYD